MSGCSLRQVRHCVDVTCMFFLRVLALHSSFKLLRFRAAPKLPRCPFLRLSPSRRRVRRGHPLRCDCHRLHDCSNLPQVCVLHAFAGLVRVNDVWQRRHARRYRLRPCTPQMPRGPLSHARASKFHIFEKRILPTACFRLTIISAGVSQRHCCPCRLHPRRLRGQNQVRSPRTPSLPCPYKHQNKNAVLNQPQPRPRIHP